MFEDAVEVGIAAFQSADHARSEDEAYRWLTDSGVEDWLSDRLLSFLPLAFGRRILSGMDLTFSDTFSDGPTDRSLLDEPVFQAATTRAEHASRSELERIGLRSAEVNAINQALNSGADIAGAALGPVVLFRPLLPAGNDDGGIPSPAAIFAKLLAGHGLPGTGGRVGDLTFTARLFPDSGAPTGLVMGQVDFMVEHPALAVPQLIESVANLGRTWREVVADCASNFAHASLHPIIATLLDRKASVEQVEWTPYAHSGGPFDVCLGPTLVKFTNEPVPPAEDAIAEVLATLRDEPLSRAIHGLRVFTYHQDGQAKTIEVLVDNEPWPAGQAVVAAMAAPTATGPVSRRVFALLTPSP